MKSAIRLAVLILMASTSTAALAGGSEASSDARGSAAAQSDATAPSKNDTDSQEAGHGSGEPGRPLVIARADESAGEKAALAEYNQESYVQQAWMASP